MTTKHILVVGNICDGHTFYGPFDTFDDADRESRAHDLHHNTWIATLEPPVTKAETQGGLRPNE